MNLTDEQAEDPSALFDIHLSEVNIEDLAKDPDAHIPFSVAANALGKNINTMFSQADTLMADIEKFRFQMGNYFMNVWRNSMKYQRYWREEYLTDFLDWPMLSFPVECEDVHCKRHARWVMAPRFFAPSFGIQIPMAGGFGLQLCNQYTRLAFPLEIEEATALQVASTLDLSVIGNKIIGPSLPFCWSKIPGIAEDVDATAHHPSVYIKNNEAARPWLANQGVNPWEKNPIPSENMAFDTPPELTVDNKEFVAAWAVLKETGRIGLFHHSLQNSREAAMFLATMLRGVKCFFVNSVEDEFYYKNIRRTLAGRFQDSSVSKSQYIYCHNGNDLILEQLQKAAVVVLDMNHGGIDSEIVGKLFDYRGVMIVVNTDPMMDYTTDNFLCPRIYGLAGFPVFDSELFPVETNNRTYVANKQNENSYVALIKSMKDNVKTATYESIKELFLRTD